MKFSANQFKIERLTPIHNISSFSSDEKELKDFLVEDALENQNRKISVTYLWFYENNLVGYITLCNDRISLEGDLKLYFNDKGVSYKSLPALKIARLCVDDKYLRRGIGTLMIDFSIKIASHVYNKYAGCRFIVLDAKRNDSQFFYKKLGFKILKERQKGTIPMYLDLINNIKFSI